MLPLEIIENVIPVAIKLLILLVVIYSVVPVKIETVIPVSAIKLLIFLCGYISVSSSEI